MDEPISCESIQEPLDDEERELKDLETWEWDDPAEVTVIEDFRVQLLIELTQEEIDSWPVPPAPPVSHEIIKRKALDNGRAART